jgi:hypothetical protein
MWISKVQEAVDALSRSSSLIENLGRTLAERESRLKELQVEYNRVSQLASLTSEQGEAVAKSLEAALGRSQGRERLTSFGINIAAGLLLFSYWVCSDRIASNRGGQAKAMQPLNTSRASGQTPRRSDSSGIDGAKAPRSRAWHAPCCNSGTGNFSVPGRNRAPPGRRFRARRRNIFELSAPQSGPFDRISVPARSPRAV